MEMICRITITGNQQKVVIAKWLATEPRIIILDEPTKGIDVGSKGAVHGFMTELVKSGLSVGTLNVPGIVMSIVIGAMLISVIALPIIWQKIRNA